MTDLSTPKTSLAPRLPVWLAIVLLVATSLAGCIGDDTTDGETSNEDTFSVFLAASGTASEATATVEGVAVTLADTQGTQFLDLDTEAFDLAELASSEQALLAATSTDLDTNVTETIVVFERLEVGNRTLTDTRMEVPLAYIASPGTEVTVTLDLDKIQDTGQPALDHLIVERDGQTQESVTGSELEGSPVQEVPELAEPTIVATAAEGNDTAPSFGVNVEVDFTIDIEETQDAQVREVFWQFSDGTTTAGEEITHAFRTAGLHNVTAIVEGNRGQQAFTQASVDVYWTTEGEGNIGLGTGGSGLLEGRDVKNHSLKVPGPFANLSLRFEASDSGGLDGAPSNLHIELYDPARELFAENTTDSRIKYINNTTTGEDPFPNGTWELRVKGDSGAAVGYSYLLEVHYLRLVCGLDGNVTAPVGTTVDDVCA